MSPDPAAEWLVPQQCAGRAATLPARCYVDAAFAALERDAVFGKSWQLVAHAAQVRDAGDHAVAEIAGVPLVVVRGVDGALRALHNVCRHRAGPLATCDGRGARVLTCRYHGWTYALDGALRGAPGMHGAEAFDVAAIRLPQAQVAEWHGLVFAALDAAPPFPDLVAGVEARLGALAFDGYVFDRRVSYELACNWKVYVDNYLEGYHLQRVHPALARLLGGSRYRTQCAAWHVLQSSPLDPAAGPYGESGHAAEAQYWWLWPNTMLNLLPGRLQTNRVIPLDAQRCRVEFDYYYAPGTDPRTASQDREFADQVQSEDSAICEAVQRGLASGSYDRGRLNPAQEAGVFRFHELLRAAYRARFGG
jgi:choline monooxygenase